MSFVLLAVELVFQLGWLRVVAPMLAAAADPETTTVTTPTRATAEVDSGGGGGGGGGGDDDAHTNRAPREPRVVSRCATRCARLAPIVKGGAAGFATETVTLAFKAAAALFTLALVRAPNVAGDPTIDATAYRVAGDRADLVLVRPPPLVFALALALQTCTLFFVWFLYMRRVTATSATARDVERRTRLTTPESRLVFGVALALWILGPLHRCLDFA